MLQARGMLDSNDTDPTKLLPQIEAVLGLLPHPSQESHWQFFSNRLDDDALKFWSAIHEKDFDPLWNQPETLGWCYQYFLEPGLKTFRSFNAPKIRENQLAFRTQQFTPRWIADFMVQNALGQMWLHMHPETRLGRSWPYLVPAVNANGPPGPPVLARQIRILDPACGAMHLGFSAIRILEMMYREELENAGRKGWPGEPSVFNEAQIIPAIIRHNLFGIDIDTLTLELATLGLFIEIGKPFSQPPNLCVGDTLKKTIFTKLQKKKFPTRFDIVLLNPPYLDKRDYNPKLKSFMAKHFEFSSRNLYSAFLERSINLLADGGRIGAVTPQTFMFIRSFEKFRQFILDHTVVETLAHTGLNTFEDAVVDCSIYVLKRQESPERRNDHLGQFLQLTAMNSSDEKNSCILKLIDALRNHSTAPTCCYRYRQSDFAALPGSPWVYWISDRIRRLFSDLPDFAGTAKFCQGLATTDNDRFVRFWWEVPSDQIAVNCRSLDQATTSNKKWFPYMKGGGYCKWYGMQKYLVNWADDGREIKEEIIKRYTYLKGNWQWVAKNTEFYFREGVTYSYLTSGKFSARYSPPGSIFDVAGSSIFSDDPYQILGILNSRWCRFALGLINHTVNFQVGDLQRLPAPCEHSPALNQLVRRAIELSRRLETFDETSPDFIAPPPWPNGCQAVDGIHRELDEIQNRIDDEVYRLYGKLNDEDRRLIERLTPDDHRLQTISQNQLARQWISYSVGIVLGRYLAADISSKMRFAFPAFHPLLMDDRHGFAADVITALEFFTGQKNSRNIIHAAADAMPLHSFLARDFFENHFQLYHQRPVYWLLKKDSKLFVAYYHTLTEQGSDGFAPLWQKPIRFDYDLGILKNMTLIKKSLALPAWRRYLS
jgi:hypothetical protein